MSELAKHYQSVTQAWRIIMGERQHFGWYEKENETIDDASANIIDALLKNISLSHNQKILEIGCGVGGSARYLCQKYHCEIHGIALAEKEISEANELGSQEIFQNKLHFLQADAQQNPYPDDTFDYVLLFESALLIPDKKALFNHCLRVLKPGGQILLFEPIKLREMTAAEMYKFGHKLESLGKSFGQNHTESFTSLRELLEQAGFKNILSEDVSKQVSPSPLKWKTSAISNQQKLSQYFSQEQYQHFLNGCDALSELMKNKILGYGFLSGRKPADGTNA